MIVNRSTLLVAGAVLILTVSTVAWVLVGRSQPSRDEAAAAILVLLAVVGFLYRRSVAASRAVERMAREKEALLGISRDEARTDPLTDLGNRRALARDLAAAIADPRGEELLLAILDLDGFKQYNDSYGHAAGDSLLQRLAARVAAAATAHAGRAYRMGGDEFCVFARTSPDTAWGDAKSQLYKLRVAAQYQSTRGVISRLCQDFLNANIDAVLQEGKDPVLFAKYFNAFVEHFQAVMAYLPERADR